MPDDPAAGAVSVPLAPGVDVHCAIQDLDGSIELGIKHEGKEVERELVPPEAPGKTFTLELGRLKIDLRLGVDHVEGEIEAGGKVTLRDSDDEEEHTLVELDEVLLRYNPTHGSVGQSAEPQPPHFDDPRFGQSRMSSKNVTRILVDDRERQLADVGRVVKKALWDDYPDWAFNTVACVGEFDAEGRGSYSDPNSIWFNVFLGYYQIDAPKPDWTRPFGYESAKGAASQADFEEIVRLGKSDWGYFSNWMYGVPDEAIERHNSIRLPALKTSQSDAGVIGSSGWHRVSIGGVDFVSAYEAGAGEAEELVNNSVLSRLWRKAFGKPNPRPEFSESFIESKLDADMYIAYWEDEAAFHTVIFGGTAPTGGHPAFLAGQMEAAKKVIGASYPALGFKAGQ